MPPPVAVPDSDRVTVVSTARVPASRVAVIVTEVAPAFSARSVWSPSSPLSVSTLNVRLVDGWSSSVRFRLAAFTVNPDRVLVACWARVMVSISSALLSSTGSILRPVASPLEALAAMVTLVGSPEKS